MLWHLSPAPDPAQLEQEWQVKRHWNEEWKAEFYEGLVAKRVESAYPIQLRDPDAHCPYWIKHRWAW